MGMAISTIKYSPANPFKEAKLSELVSDTTNESSSPKERVNLSNDKFPKYRKDLIEKARKLRKSSTPGEIELWKLIRNKQVLGFQFRRQRPVDNFIIDFYCKELKLAIEIDGSSHDYKIEYDCFRQTKLEQLGITFLRFSEKDTKENADYVVKEIEGWTRKYIQNNNTLPSPCSPPLEGKLKHQDSNLNNESSSPRKRNSRRDAFGKTRESQ